MSQQLEVVKFRDLIPVRSIPRVVPGLSNTTVEVVGEDFSSVETVLINDIQVPEFIVVDGKTMWAQLPDNVDSVQTIEVQSSKFTRTAAGSKLKFEIGEATKTVSGILKLTQLFTKWMLQSPGSDIFDPGRGGGLQRLVGQILTSKKMESVGVVLARSIDQTASQIRTTQVNEPNLPLDERLLSAALIGVNISGDKMEASARVRIISMAGDEAVSGLTL